MTEVTITVVMIGASPPRRTNIASTISRIPSASTTAAPTKPLNLNCSASNPGVCERPAANSGYFISSGKDNAIPPTHVAISTQSAPMTYIVVEARRAGASGSSCG
ncbi:MAG: hypothetical protein ABIP55_10665 [Tepidisphaeraceae bacterium]